jgi:hypothetical protein
MSTRTLDAADRSFLTTDYVQIGFAVATLADPGAVNGQPANVSEIQQDSSWATLLQGELEEAVDTLLLRATLANTLTLSGGNHQLFN